MEIALHTLIAGGVIAVLYLGAVAAETVTDRAGKASIYIGEFGFIATYALRRLAQFCVVLLFALADLFDALSYMRSRFVRLRQFEGTEDE